MGPEAMKGDTVLFCDAEGLDSPALLARREGEGWRLWIFPGDGSTPRFTREPVREGTGPNTWRSLYADLSPFNPPSAAARAGAAPDGTLHFCHGARCAGQQWPADFTPHPPECNSDDGDAAALERPGEIQARRGAGGAVELFNPAGTMIGRSFYDGGADAGDDQADDIAPAMEGVARAVDEELARKGPGLLARVRAGLGLATGDEKPKPYLERNTIACALARLTLDAGGVAGVMTDPDETDARFARAVIVELPTGRVGWHLDASDPAAPWGHLPELAGDWQAFTPAENWERVTRFLLGEKAGG